MFKRQPLETAGLTSLLTMKRAGLTMWGGVGDGVGVGGQLLEKAGLTMKDIGVFEMHEAFAGQVRGGQTSAVVKIEGWSDEWGVK